MEQKTNVPVPPIEKPQGKPKKDDRKKPPQVKPAMPMRGFAVWFLMMALVLMAVQMFNKPQAAERLSYNPDFTQMEGAAGSRAAKLSENPPVQIM